MLTLPFAREVFTMNEALTPFRRRLRISIEHEVQTVSPAQHSALSVAAILARIFVDLGMIDGYVVREAL